MSFATALLTYVGARNAAKAQAAQQQNDNAYRNSQLDLQRQQADQTSQDDALSRQLTQQQLDAGKRQAAQDAAIKSQDAGLQLPKGWSTMSPVQQIAYLQKRINAGQQVGNSDLVTQTEAQINAIPRADETFSHADYYRQMPQMMRDKLASQDQMLKERLGAHTHDVMTAIMGRADLAQFNDAQKHDLAVLAASNAMARVQAQQGGAFQRVMAAQVNANGRTAASIAGFDERSVNSDDMRKAIAEYETDMKAHPDTATFTDPTPYQAQPVQINVEPGYSQYQPWMPPVGSSTPPKVPGLTGSAPAAASVTASRASDPTKTPAYANALTGAKAALSRGASVKDVTATIATLSLPPAAKTALLRAIGAAPAATTDATTPVGAGGFTGAALSRNGGGATPANPFSRVRFP